MTALREGWVDLSQPDVALPSPRPTRWDLAVYIPGVPVQKGSMRGRVLGTGQMIRNKLIRGKLWAQLYHDNEDEQDLWVRQACAALSVVGAPAQPWAGPIYVWALAILPRPKSLGQRLAAMIQKPDADKLARSVLDVLTVAKVYGDDKQVTHQECEKRYAGIGEAPGLHLRVARLDEEST